MHFQHARSPVPIVGLLLMLWSPSLPAQEGSSLAQFDELVQVEEVLLDVLAVDGEGQVVRGLGADDFEVLENGEPMPLTSVGFYTSFYEASKEGAGHTHVHLGAGTDPATGAWEEIPASRYFVLFFHDPLSGGSIGNYRRRQLQKAQQGARDWVTDHLAPSDWVAVASYDSRLKIHQDFTQDREALSQAIEDATRRRDPDADHGRRGRPLPPLGTPSLRRHLPQGLTSQDDLRKATRTFYDGLRLLAEASGYVVGRKNLVFFSAGFGDLDPFSLVAQPDPRRYPRMEEALNEYNLAVYAVDLTPKRIRHFQEQPMIRLSLATGGRYFRDPIDFATPLKRVSQETQGYYLLSYQSEHPTGETGFQRVKVRLKEGASKDDIRLRFRTGYRYGPAPEAGRREKR